MKLALLVPGGVDRSGRQRVIPVLLAMLKRLGRSHEVHVFALAQERQPGHWWLQGTQIHNIGGPRGVRRQAGTIGAVLREHRTAPFDLVHSIWAAGCGLAAVTAAKLLGVPSLVHIAGGELTALPEIGWGGCSTLKGKICEALVLRTATAVSGASAPILAQIAAYGRAAHRVALGIDLEEWPERLPVRRDLREPLRLIHVASLNRVKDQTTLLRAVAVLATARLSFVLDIVGEDTLGGCIQQQARQLGLDKRVTFHGFLTHQHLRPLMEQAHVNVVSSRHEAGPLVVLEAAAIGVPTAGTSVGHIAEWAPAAALAVPIGDFEELARAIRRLAECEELRLALAARALQRALAEDADWTFAQFDALYTELTGATPKQL